MATQVSAYAEQLVHEIDKTPEEYLPNLLQIIRLFRESVTLRPAEVSFQQQHLAEIRVILTLKWP